MGRDATKGKVSETNNDAIVDGGVWERWTWQKDYKKKSSSSMDVSMDIRIR